MHEPFSSTNSTDRLNDAGHSHVPDEAGSLNLSQAIQYARAVQGELRPDDPRLEHTVHLACKDGTNLNLPHAFVETSGDWVCVFTRDHGYFVEPKDGLALCSTSERRPN